MKNQGKKRKLLKALELPEEIASGATKISMVSFEKIRIDNYKSLIEYERDVIRVNTKEKLIKITGEDMELSEVTDESVEITGKIAEVNFE